MPPPPHPPKVHSTLPGHNYNQVRSNSPKQTINDWRRYKIFYYPFHSTHLYMVHLRQALGTMMGWCYVEVSCSYPSLTLQKFSFLPSVYKWHSQDGCGLLTVACVLWGSSTGIPAAVARDGGGAAGSEEGGAYRAGLTAGSRSNCANRTSWRKVWSMQKVAEVNYRIDPSCNL